MNNNQNKRTYEKKSYEKKTYNKKEQALVKPKETKLGPLEVGVRDNNIEQALRVLKNMMAKENVLGELREKRYFEKPSEKRRRKMREGIKKAEPIKKKVWVNRSKIVASVPINKWEE